MLRLFVIYILFTLNVQAAQCPAGQYWVTAHHRKAYIKSDGTPVRATFVKAHCRSKSKEHEYLEPRLKDGLPPRWPRKEKGKTWTEEDRERLKEALEAIPQELRAKNIKGIYRGIRAADHPNPANHYSEKIVLYDEAFSERYNLSRVIAHELAHQVYGELSREDKLSYQKKMGWIVNENGEEVLVDEGRSIVADDSNDSTTEDFANNVEFRLFQSEHLKKAAPEAFEWLEKRFNKKLQLRGNSK